MKERASDPPVDRAGDGRPAARGMATPHGSEASGRAPGGRPGELFKQRESSFSALSDGDASLACPPISASHSDPRTLLIYRRRSRPGPKDSLLIKRNGVGRTKADPRFWSGFTADRRDIDAHLIGAPSNHQGFELNRDPRGAARAVMHRRNTFNTYQTSGRGRIHPQSNS